MIHEASTPEHYRDFAQICRLYIDWCRERYAAAPTPLDEVFRHQSLDHELASLAEKYGPPKGRTFLLREGREVLGAGAWHHLNPTTAELKRVFLLPGARGRGEGRQLVQALLESARAQGCQTACLDTGHLMTEAIALYRSLGFTPCAPYQPYPTQIQTQLIYFEKPL